TRCQALLGLGSALRPREQELPLALLFVLLLSDLHELLFPLPFFEAVHALRELSVQCGLDPGHRILRSGYKTFYALLPAHERSPGHTVAHSIKKLTACAPPACDMCLRSLRWVASCRR